MFFTKNSHGLIKILYATEGDDFVSVGDVDAEEDGSDEEWKFNEVKEEE